MLPNPKARDAFLGCWTCWVEDPNFFGVVLLADAAKIVGGGQAGAGSLERERKLRWWPGHGRGKRVCAQGEEMLQSHFYT